jgi:hypothetical protein
VKLRGSIFVLPNCRRALVSFAFDNISVWLSPDVGYYHDESHLWVLTSCFFLLRVKCLRIRGKMNFITVQLQLQKWRSYSSC